ncbi:MAG: hypothetical protein NT172_14265 [Planctomycetota bacterium]|nr:hypothetical protein [Planctomycetota bacterium]
MSPLIRIPSPDCRLDQRFISHATTGVAIALNNGGQLSMKRRVVHVVSPVIYPSEHSGEQQSLDDRPAEQLTSELPDRTTAANRVR